MKFFPIIRLTVIIIVISSAHVNAQRILDRAIYKAREKLEQKAEEKIEEKIDQKIDEEIEKLEEKNKKENDSTEKRTETADEKSQRRMQGILRGMGISGEPVPYDDSYSFTSKIQIKMSTLDGKGKTTSESELITYMNPDDLNFAYEIISGDAGNKGSGIFILDFKNKASIILNEEQGNKTGLIYGLGFMLGENYTTEEPSVENADAELSRIHPYLTKTGRSKKILGYDCDEYHYNNPEEKEEGWYWLTKDLKVQSRDYFGTLFTTSAYANTYGWGGYLMESEFIDKETGDKSMLLVTDINTRADKRYDLKNYQLTNIGNITAPSGNQ